MKHRFSFKQMSLSNQNMIKNILGAFCIRGCALFVSLATMPAFMRYFENQQVLGVWFTILSVITWILNFDLGIGNGLRNQLVTVMAKGDKEDIKGTISSAYVIIGILVGFIIAAGYSLAPFVDWNEVFGVSKELVSARTMLCVTRYVFVGIMLQFFFRLITSIIYALQKSALNNLIALVTSIAQLIFVILAPVGTVEENLIQLSLANIFFANMPLIIATVVIFLTKLKGCFPRFRYVQRKYVKSIMLLGGIFFWCQIMYMLIANSNEFFITQYSGPTVVVEYQIYFRLFSLVGMLLTLALSPVWSAVTKSIAEKDFLSLHKLYTVLKKIAVLGVALEIVLIPFLQIITDIWLGENTIQINYVYAVLFALFGAVFIYQTVLSTVVCGIGTMKLQAYCYTVGVALKFLIIPLGMWLFHSWIIVVTANILILIPYCVLQQISLNRYIQRNLFERGSKLV